MDRYYVNNIAQSTGEHEVHKDGCSFFPSDREYLGYFSSCKEAIAEARKTYSNVDGCFFCCPECHTR
jgi:hypothetical protein